MLKRTLLSLFCCLAASISLISCGGSDSSPAQAQVEYAGSTLVVDGVSYAANAADLVANRGTVYVFSSNSASDQATLTQDVARFGLSTGEFSVQGRSPPFTGAARVRVPEGFESQWAQALRTAIPSSAALTFLPCC